MIVYDEKNKVFYANVLKWILGIHSPSIQAYVDIQKLRGNVLVVNRTAHGAKEEL